MSFHFELQGLLRVRRLLEQQARKQLEESMMRVRHLERSLSEAIQWHQRTSSLRTGSAPLPAAELQFLESVLHQTQQAISQCERNKQAEELRASQLRTAYLQARRERKTVSTLRSAALLRFETEQSRREQSSLDEMFLGKLIRSRNTETPPQQDS